MIDEERTLEIYGYYSHDLVKSSRKYVVRVCEECGRYTDIIYVSYNKNKYPDMCQSCIIIMNWTDEEYRKNMLIASAGKHVGMLGKHHSPEACAKIGRSCTGSKSHMYGKPMPLETRILISCTNQNIHRDEWDGFVNQGDYCEKFDNACRERNREKYGRKCFLCGKHESENIAPSGKLRKLSVHHYDMNKNAGCNGDEWKLVPLCMKCHPGAHSKMWTARIEYLLIDEECVTNV